MSLSITLTFFLFSLFVVQLEGLTYRVKRDESSHSSDPSINPKMSSDVTTNADLKKNTTISKIILNEDDDNDVPFILGGDEAEENKWKFMVAILRKSYFMDELRLHCGGSLITEQHVLTAAHCFYDLDEDLDDFRVDFLLKIGTHDNEKTNIDARIEKIHLNGFNETSMENDIAILELKDKVNLTNNPHISLVKLPQKNNTYLFQSDNGTLLASIAGWGRIENGTASKKLLAADMAIVGWEECKRLNKVVGDGITSQQICAIQRSNAKRPTDTCQGDSGGPLMQFDNNSQDFIQTGITSFGEGCAKPGIPGAYARVDQFLDWIHKVTNNRTEN